MSGLGRKPQYYLIACGTKDYDYLGESEQLPSVENDIEKIVEVLGKFGYKRVLDDVLHLNPTLEALRTAFARWLLEKDLTEHDLIIFYYSGHGEYIDGDRHYLILKETEEKLVRETSFPTDGLVGPLLKPEIKVSKILYIIDTCYSGQGISDISKFTSDVIEKHQPKYSQNRRSIHLIAASRSRQEAKTGVFSDTFKSVLEKFIGNEKLDIDRHISPDIIVKNINDFIREAGNSRQEVGHSKGFSGEEVCFFPIFPEFLCAWENVLDEKLSELFSIFKSEQGKIFFLVNSYLLSSSVMEKIVLDWSQLKHKLLELGKRPVVDGICQLFACSEWLKRHFSFRNYPGDYREEVVSFIDNWQARVTQVRKGIDRDKIKKDIDERLERFQALIEDKSPRLVIEMKPEIDVEKNTGRNTGVFSLDINLWINDRISPIARLAEEKFDLQSFGCNSELPVERFIAILKKEKILSKYPSEIYKILSLDTDVFHIDLSFEFFLPLEYFNASVEHLTFNYTRRIEKVLGQEYPVFINSYERYYDNELILSKNNIHLKKREMWESDNYNPRVLHQDELNIDEFDYFDIFVGSEPLSPILEIVEAAFPIAVWSRDNSINLRDELDENQWQDWLNQIQLLRKANKNANITIFWDDLYPKPSEKTCPLNTSVVE
jgi:hypothetical protein